MSITFRYYVAGPRGLYESPGKMILVHRQARFRVRKGYTERDGEFSYSPVQSIIDISGEGQKKVRQSINFLFLEKSYGVGQREILAHLGWMQRQKLRWMFRDHFLQRPGNLIHAAIISLVVGLALILIVYLEGTNLF